MKVIAIQVAPISRKILLAEYGCSEPILLDRRDLLYDQMRAVKIGHNRYGALTLQWMSEEVAFEIYDELAKHIERRNHNIGMAIYHFHVDMMMRFTEACVGCGLSIREGLRRFYDRYGITERDYDFDTAYRRYSAFQKNRNERLEIFRTKRLPVKSPVYDASSADHQARLLLRDELCTERTAGVIAALAQKGRSLPASFAKHLRWHMLKAYGGFSFRDIGRRDGVAHSTVASGVASMRNWMTTDAHIAEMVSEAMRDAKGPLVG